MPRSCDIGACPGPAGCWLRAILEKPTPPPVGIPGLEPEDVHAVRTMTECPIREELENEFPDPFEEARN